MANKGRTVMVQGRIIWAVGGSVFKGKPVTNKQTNQPKLDKNNVPLVQRGFGLAIDKSIFQVQANMAPGGVGEFWQALYDEAWTLYPDRQVPKNFAWKRIDGDTDTDETGRPWNTKQGYAGHIVLPCTTNVNINFYKYNAALQKPELVNDGIKVGDYVQVQLNISAHPPVKANDGSMGKPGLYLNPLAVLFLAPGEAIVTQQDGEDIFGSSAPAPAAWMKVVADTTPQMGQMAQMPGMPAAAPVQPPVQQYQQPQAAPMAPQYQQPQHQYAQPAPMQQTPAPVQPNYDVVPQQFNPQFAQPAPVQPPVQQYQQPQAAPMAPQYQQPQQYAQPAPMAGPPMPPGVPR